MFSSGARGPFWHTEGHAKGGNRRPDAQDEVCASLLVHQDTRDAGHQRLVHFMVRLAETQSGIRVTGFWKARGLLE